jgi:murein DD-endopeptidase MepM/ murein hydrolase activator NlpD
VQELPAVDEAGANGGGFSKVDFAGGKSPFAGVDFTGGGNGSGSFGFLGGVGGGGPWDRLPKSMLHHDKTQEQVNAIYAGKQPGNTTVTAADGGYVPGAADNSGITAQQVEAYIAKGDGGKSPLRGKGQYIIDIANKYGVSVPQMMGILQKESQFGVTAGANKNLTGIVASDDGGRGTNRRFNGYATWEESLEATAINLSTPMYKGKPIAEQVGNWYVGPQAYRAEGINATDLAGNGTVGDYLNNYIAPAFAYFGKPLTSVSTPVAIGKPGTGVYSFPVVGYGGTIQLHHGADQGASDIFAAAGTAVVAMRAGRVVDAGWNNLGGWTVTIQGDDGLTYYYAHLQSQPLVSTGGTVKAGTTLGGVGDTGNAKGTGAHLHLGIGYGIQEGAGATGGSGKNFNAVDLLNQTYRNQYAVTNSAPR